MNFQETEIKTFTLWAVIAALAVLVFLILRPVFMAVIGGLLLAYIFRPAYNRLFKITKRKNLSAFAIALAIILIVLVPLWFLIPLMLQQVFALFASSHTINTAGIISSIFPTASAQFTGQMVSALDSFIGKMTVLILEYLNSLFLDLPTLSLDVLIAFFVFFYGLRDYDKIGQFLSDLSPFTKAREKAIIDQFKNITDSVVYGQIIIGLVQGGLAGLGLLIFGVDNVLVLTAVAIFLSILPVIGPFVIWIPVTIYFFTSGQVGAGIGYLLYNVLIVTTIDNVLRIYLVSRKSDMSPAVAFIAMIGGFIAFGMVGFIIGPLLVAYFVMFLQAFREKNVSQSNGSNSHLKN